MRRTLLILVSAAVLLLPAAASARGGQPSTGFLVVRNATGDGTVYGHPVVTVVVQGFVLGRVKQQGRVDIYQLSGGTPAAHGSDVSSSRVRWRGHVGTEYNGSGFRFSAIDGAYRVVVRGSGIYVFAGGQGRVTLHGSVADPGGDGRYSINGATPRSLPTRAQTHAFGGG